MVRLDSHSLDLRHQTGNFMLDMISRLTVESKLVLPTDFVSSNRYIPNTVSPFPGFVDFSITPQWIEILNSMSPWDPTREVVVMKGVQIAYTTNLENAIFYDVGCLRSVPLIFATADLGLSQARMDANILPMFQHSGMEELFVSADIKNTRKKGIKRSMLQWIGGGYMLPYGAQNANKARQQSVPHVYMDEVDGWPMTSKDGSDLIGLFCDRGSSFWASPGTVKIFIGSTPNNEGESRIHRKFLEGDQREYRCRCLKCGFPQVIRFSGRNKQTGKDFGIKWEMTSSGQLDQDTVRYECANCGEAHMEHDKPKFFGTSNAEWVPTATPVDKLIKSYKMPALLSMSGLQPWYKSVNLWLEAWDTQRNRVRDMGKLQRFYNNVLAEPFAVPSMNVKPEHVSGHRRMFYMKGSIPNKQISQHCLSKVLFVTMTVDVHKDGLYVAVWGWARPFNPWLVDYFKIEDNTDIGTESSDSEAWARLAEIITEGTWKADDGTMYYSACTLIDSQYNTAVVVDFCALFEGGNVFPIMGKATIGSRLNIREFDVFTTQLGTRGFNILIDLYKDRIAPVLRREWHESEGVQDPYTFSCPADTTDDELKELTVEKKRPVKESPTGIVKYEWHRPHGSANELWDLLVYAHASVEILSWLLHQQLGIKEVDMEAFWDEVEENLPFTV